MEKQQITIALSGTGLHSVEKSVAELKRAGLEEVQVLGEIGTVTGAATRPATARIRRLECVSAVEAAGEIQLPPEGSPQ